MAIDSCCEGTGAVRMEGWTLSKAQALDLVPLVRNMCMNERETDRTTLMLLNTPIGDVDEEEGHVSTSMSTSLSRRSLRSAAVKPRTTAATYQRYKEMTNSTGLTEQQLDALIDLTRFDL